MGLNSSEDSIIGFADKQMRLVAVIVQSTCEASTRTADDEAAAPGVFSPAFTKAATLHEKHDDFDHETDSARRMCGTGMPSVG